MVSRETPRPAPSPRSLSRDEVAERAREVLETILGHLVEAPRVEEIRDGGDSHTIHLSVRGADTGIVIGRHGQTLDALEHLVSRIVLREEVSPDLRILVDMEGYRQRRQESLEQLARRLADKAKATGRAVALDPMTPRDRRTVHLALQSDPAVTTISEGEGNFRRLVITPQDGRQGRETQRTR